MKHFFILFFIFSYTIGFSLDFSGFADIYLSSFIEGENNIVSSYQRFRGNLSQDFDNSFIFASFNGKLNNLDNSKELFFHELYFDYANDYFELRLGKQLVVWGSADGLRITDLICPSDFNEVMAQEFDDIRVPLNLIRLKTDLDFCNLEFIWIPLYQTDIFPQKSSPYYVEGANLENLQVPKSKVENSEIAGKVSFFTSNFDVALSYLHLWNDSPVYLLTNTGQTPYFFRRNIVGLEFSKPLESVVVRSEVALNINNKLSGFKIAKKNSTKSMVGFDYYLNSTFSLSMQYLNEKIWDYEDFILEDENKHTFTLNVHCSFLRETLKLGNLIYYSLNEESLLENFSLDYAVNDNLHFLTGLNCFFVDKKSMFNKKSQIWLKSKFNF